MHPVKLKENENKRPRIVYILTVFAQFSLINQGYDMGASSGAILLAKDIDYLRLTKVWKQLIMAGPMISAIVFSLIGALLSDQYGRKKGLLMASSFYVLGYIVTGSAFNRETLFIGRLLIGCGIGIASANTAVYVAECSPSNLRGRLIGVSQPFLTIGILIGIFISVLFSYDLNNGWRYTWGLGAVPALIQFIAMLFLPESPRWFIQKFRRDDATESLMRIRNSKYVEEELKEIEDNFKEVQESIKKSGGGGGGGRMKLFIRMLKTSTVRRALMVGCGLHMFAQFSGVNTVIYYSGIILQMSGIGNVTNALWNSVIINCVNLLFAIIGVWLVDKVGRRKLSIIGLFGLFISSLCLATTFLMADRYSPWANTTDLVLNDSCSTYRQCGECIRNADCGFCYEDTPDVIGGDCLRVSATSNLVSEQGACNSSLTLSKYSMIWAYDYCPVSFTWIAVVGLALFLMFYAPGMGTLPWTINAEIYPLWARSIGNGMACMTCWTCVLITTSSFLSFIELIRTSGVFYVMASVALVGSIFCFLFLPETKNKSLEEIEKLFSPKKEKLSRKILNKDSSPF